MLDFKYQTLLGAIVLVMMGGFFAYTSTTGKLSQQDGVSFYVEFARMGVIETGTAVKIGQHKIGTVEGIRLIDKNKESLVRLKLWVKKEYADYIFINSRFYFESISIIGMRHINIAMPPEEEEPKRRIRQGDIVKGVDPSKLDRILKITFATLVTNIKMWEDIEEQWTDSREKFKKFTKLAEKYEKQMLPLIESLLNSLENLVIPQALLTLSKLDQNYSFPGRIVALGNKTGKQTEITDKKMALIEHKLKQWPLKDLQAKIKRLKKNINNIKTIISSLKTYTTVIQNKLQGRNGTISGIMNDRAIFDNLRVMAKRLKNSIYDLVFKKQRKAIE
ncbi:MAG: MlaD family protein [Myxococcota bacterium]